MADSGKEVPSGGMSQIYRETVLRQLFAGAKRHAAEYRRIDLAHAAMLVETGILPRGDGARLIAAIEGLDGDFDLSTLEFPEAFEDLIYLREDRLKRRVGADLAGRLHTGRSCNDLEATLFRIQLKSKLSASMADIAALARSVLAVARREAATPILAYTHGQPAQPTTYGHYLCAFIEVLVRDLERLALAFEQIDACPMGAAAITTTGFPISRERMAELLGFARVQTNAYGCIASADQLAGVYSALRLYLLNIGRIVQDFAFWTSFEVRQARAPDGYVQISSIMPQKRNPLAIEHLRAMSSLGAGRCDSVVGAIHNTPFADMVDGEGPTQAAGMEAFETAAFVTKLFAGFFEGIEIDELQVARNIDLSCATMTELADSLVRTEGIAFRQAHEIGSNLAREIVRRGGAMSSLDAAAIAEAFVEATGRQPKIDQTALLELTGVSHFIQVRDRTGGTSKKALESQFAALASALTITEAKLEAGATREATGKLLLAEAVAAIA
jgi:argininosuccinate lyase